MAYKLYQINNKNINTKATEESSHYVITLNKQVIKLGYCCEPKGIEYPIYINNIQIDINKDTMYEVDMLDISTIKIPKDIEFTLEYVVNDNTNQ